jgi:proteasome beta subunit
LGGGGVIGANPSFFDLLASTRSDAMPRLAATAEELRGVPHGTTVLGLKFADGVVFAGDRRATEGYSIADDKMEKVFAADDLSVIAIAGAAGQAIEIVKLFQLELEH